MFKNKKASLSLYISVFIACVVIILVAAVFVPAGIMINTKAYVAGEGILNDTLPIINQISDPTVKASILGVVTEARDATQDNIEVNADIFKYSWVIILVIVGLVAFLSGRRLVEFSRGGGYI